MESSRYQVVGEKRVKLSLIKTQIKNKYVVEAYERLESSKNLKQLLFTCLSDVGKITCCSAFINKDNVFNGVMDLMKRIQQLREKEKRFHGHVTVPELDKFMNSEFQLWVQEQEKTIRTIKASQTGIGAECKGAKSIKKPQKGSLISSKEGVLSSHPEKNKQSRLKKVAQVQHVPVQNLGKISNPLSATERENTVDIDFEDFREDTDNSPKVYSSKIKNGYILEVYRFKRGDVFKIFDCLCKWEGLASEKVDVSNFAKLVNGIVRKADELKRTDISLYDCFLKEFFKFPLVNVSKNTNHNVSIRDKKLENTPQNLKGTELERDKRISTQKPLTPTIPVRKTIKRKVHEGKEEKDTLKNVTPKPKYAKKVQTKVYPKLSVVTVEPKIQEKSKIFRQRPLFSKKPKKRAVGELQLKMKIQYQTKLQQIIKRQNSIIVKQRKEIRRLKQQKAGACVGMDNKGIQCTLISSTPQTVIVRVMKP